MTKKIIIEGMMCQHCAKRVTEGLNEINISDVTIDLESKSATINYSDTSITDDLIKETIEDLGFDVIQIS